MPTAGGPTWQGLWARLKAPTRLRWHLLGPEGHEIRCLEEPVASDGVVQVHLDGLRPGSDYAVVPQLGDQSWDHAAKVHFRTPRGEGAGALRLLAASCFNPPPTGRDTFLRPEPGSYRILQAMAAERADAMLWLGDNLYLGPEDHASPEGIWARYRFARAFGPLQPFLRSTRHLACVDDHDFGPNNSDASYRHAEVSRAAFGRYWPSPGGGVPGLEGTTGRWRLADVEVFLLDGRSRRGLPSLGGKPGLYGADQLAWLKQALLASSARWKLVAGGTQFLNLHARSPEGVRYERWADFAEEQADFFAWLDQAPVDHVVLLSGDRHHAELMRRDRPGGRGPVWDLTASPMTSPPHGDRLERLKPGLVPGTYVVGFGYARLDLQGPPQARELVAHYLDAEGHLRWRRSLGVARP